MVVRVLVWSVATTLMIAQLYGVVFPAVVLIIAGLSGVLAWWSWELEGSRLEPEVARLNFDGVERFVHSGLSREHRS